LKHLCFFTFNRLRRRAPSRSLCPMRFGFGVLLLYVIPEKNERKTRNASINLITRVNKNHNRSISYFCVLMSDDYTLMTETAGLPLGVQRTWKYLGIFRKRLNLKVFHFSTILLTEFHVPVTNFASCSGLKSRLSVISKLLFKILLSTYACLTNISRSISKMFIKRRQIFM